MNRTLALISLALSTIALVLAALTYSMSSERAQSILQEREDHFIEHFAPKFEAIYADFEITAPSSPPRSVEELFDPIVSLFESVSGASVQGTD